MPLRHVEIFAGVKQISFDEAYSEFLRKIELYHLEAELLAGAINVAKTINIQDLTQDQKLAVMIECRDVIVEAEWILGIKAEGERTDELHS